MEELKFDAASVTEAAAQWIRDWFSENGADCCAVIGISGGKDSSVAAALCVKALGADRVLGVLMPNGEQADLPVAEALTRWLGIEALTVNLKETSAALTDAVQTALNGALSRQSQINLPPRLRMATLYAVSQSRNGRVVNTCNLSEDFVGYSTRYGDSVGDFSPLSHLTVGEVKAMGRVLGLPEQFVEKPPSDGLCGKTDEDHLGFTYAVLDRYIRTGVCEDAETKAKIDRLHRQNLFKLQLMPSFPYQPEAR